MNLVEQIRTLLDQEFEPDITEKPGVISDDVRRAYLNGHDNGVEKVKWALQQLLRDYHHEKRGKRRVGIIKKPRYLKRG